MKRSGMMIQKRIAALTLILALMAGILCVPQTAGAAFGSNFVIIDYIWKNWDGTELYSCSVTRWSNGGQHIRGWNDSDPEYQGNTPVRPSDQLFNYTFSGWKKVSQAHSTTVFVAQYTATLNDPNKREIVWKDYNGSELKKDYLDLNTMPSWSGNPPARESDARYEYSFSGWSPAVSAVKDHAVYTAQYTSVPVKYTVTWRNEDGTVLKTAQNVEYDSIPSYDGATPVLNPTVQYTYVFDHWERRESVSEKTISFTAVYRNVYNKYPVTWKNADGTVLKTDLVEYRLKPSYTGEIPAPYTDAMYYYSFSGWTPAVSFVTGPAVYTAVFAAETRNDYTVTWKNWDGTVLETDSELPYGSMPEYNSGTPERDPDEQYTYSFLGWAPALTETTRDTTYTAGYLPEPRTYTVTWKNWNGDVLCTEEVPWGGMPEYNQNEPEKASDAQYRYIFSGWDPEVGSVTGNTVYTAQYTPTPNTYTVMFRDEDGVTPLTGIPDQTVGYNKYVTEPSAPEKEGWRFLAWMEGGTVFDFSSPLTDAANSEIILTPCYGKLYSVAKDNAAAGGSGTGSITWKGETGEASSSSITAVEGEQITLTAVPEAGSVLRSFSVRKRVQGGYENISCTMTGENSAVFAMPAGDVIVTASFVLSGDLLNSLKDENNENLFHIRSEHDLVLLSKWSADHDMDGQTVQLEQDLNMSGLDFEGFSGVFRGSFQGGGHTVSNVNVRGFASDTNTHVAFFWNLEGSVSNLTVTGSVQDIGGNATGGLVGNLLADATVSGCTSLLQANDALAYTQSPSSAFIGCYYRGNSSKYGTPLYTVEGGSSVTPDAAAAVSGLAGAGKRVIDGQTYFAAETDVTLTLTAPETVGNFVLAGFTCGGSRYLAKNDQNTYTIQCISDDLTVSPDYTYQMGLDYENGRYLVRNKADLEAVARAVRATGGCSGMTFQLMNDIDFNGASFSGIAVGTGDQFCGAFDGNGKTISNMVITGSTYYLGFIGNLGGSLNGLTLENCTVINMNASGSAGLLAGSCYNGYMYHCRVLGGSVSAAFAGAVAADFYPTEAEDNLYDTSVNVVSGGDVKTPGTCGTGFGDESYAGSDAACVMWTVRFLSGPDGVVIADPQKVANKDAAESPDVTALPVPEHFSFTGAWKRADGTVYTFDKTSAGDDITEDTDLFPVLEEEETFPVTLTDGQENGLSITADVYLSEEAGWTVPACSFTPPTGMEFEGWEYGDLVYEPGQAVALTGEKKLAARWKWIEYSIFDGSGEESEKIGTAHYGEVFGFFMIPNPGQETVSVTCVSAGGVNVEVSLEEDVYSITMPNEDVMLTAVFRALTYAVTAEGLEHGALLVNNVQADLTGDITAHYGDIVAVRPDEGYLLVSLEVKDEALDDIAQENGSFTMPELSVTLTAVIAPVFGQPDFTMPAALKTIAESAFEGLTGLTVVDAHSCTAIGENAFRNTGLTQILLPVNCTVSPAAFDTGVIYVYAPAGGSTEDYCDDYDNLIFVPFSP